MRIVPLAEIRAISNHFEIVECMRAALIAYTSGECDTPMPMHLEIASGAEVHIKSSYRRGGRHFALKIAGTFPANRARGMPVGSGMMLLSSAETGEPVAFLADDGYLTDLRTAATAAMTARELGRRDRLVGVLGTGIQARLSAVLHAEILKADGIVIWGRSRERAGECARDIREQAPQNCDVRVAASVADLARDCRLIVTCTASREPLLHLRDLSDGTHINAIGSDSPGKQELEAAILRATSLLLADSRRQCEKLGELQHTPDLWGRAVEIGEFCRDPRPIAGEAITVADFSGLGAEDLYIAEYIYERLAARA